MDPLSIRPSGKLVQSLAVERDPYRTRFESFGIVSPLVSHTTERQIAKTLCKW